MRGERGFVSAHSSITLYSPNSFVDLQIGENGQSDKRGSNWQDQSHGDVPGMKRWIRGRIGFMDL